MDWISTKERMPEKDTPVIVTFLAYPEYKKPTVSRDFALWSGKKWFWCNEDDDDEGSNEEGLYNIEPCTVPITAWMPLPKPYQE